MINHFFPPLSSSRGCFQYFRRWLTVYRSSHLSSLIFTSNAGNDVARNSPACITYINGLFIINVAKCNTSSDGFFCLLLPGSNYCRRLCGEIYRCKVHFSGKIWYHLISAWRSYVLCFFFNKVYRKRERILK